MKVLQKLFTMLVYFHGIISVLLNLTTPENWVEWKNWKTQLKQSTKTRQKSIETLTLVGFMKPIHLVRIKKACYMKWDLWADESENIRPSLTK